MEKNNLPRVLIVSRGVWDDTFGTSSTLTNLFQGYEVDKLAHIYIESAKPTTKLCHRFFQISEIALIKKLFIRKIKTGGKTYTNQEINSFVKEVDQKKEQKIMSFVRKNRSYFFLFLRELLWSFNGWKTKELTDFIKEVNPDCVLVLGDPLPLLNKLQNYIIAKSKKPAAIFMMDDIYTYKSSVGVIAKLYKYLLRRQSKKVIENCSIHFAISPKMKNEYDKIFGINSILLTKGIDYTNKIYVSKKTNTPIKIIYLGQIIYGRDHSLIVIANALKKINKESLKAQLYIYTGNYIPRAKREKLEIENTSFLMPLVPYEQVQAIMLEADIVLFVESLNKKYKNIARLSFSTKLTDYFASGKCIFAIGANDVAPIEYLQENDAAIIATSETEIEKKIFALIEKKDLIDIYSEKSFQIGRKNHEIADLNNLFYESIGNLANKKTSGF